MSVTKTSLSLFEPGTLRKLIQTTASRALACGALLPILTTVEFVEDRGVQFQVRKVASPVLKKQAKHGPRNDCRISAGSYARQSVEEPPSGDGSYDNNSIARAKQMHGPGVPRCVNPFLPYESDLYVADASATHVCLLNKFNVVDDHLLIITRAFEHQQSALGRNDFLALWRCLSEYESLGFYNAGPEAGASQPHKHLQLIPLPLSATGEGIPLDPYRPPSRVSELESKAWPPFQHALAPISIDPASAASESAARLKTTYDGLLESLGLGFHHERPPTYNLLVSRKWMLVVPRSRERFQSVSLNSLAFIGAMLVRSDQQLVELRSAGPMAALQHVAGPA